MIENRAEARAAQRAAGSGGSGRPARTGWKRWVIPLLKWGSLTALVLGMIGIGVVLYAYSQVRIPQPNEMANAQVSIVYYADGKTELDRLVADEANRESVPLSKVPKAVQDAHLSAEDRSFYSNDGVSVSGIARAIRSSITGGAQVGGSTITQQYVKNFYLSSDRTISRKFNEILIAVKIDGQLTKEQILENYLNTIYYGRGAWGIQSAARTYFGKDVSKLTAAEGAVLASIINAPSLYDPAEGENNLERLKKRYAYVLDGMVTEGWLDAAERAKLTALPTLAPPKASTYGSGTTGYISSIVRRELLTVGLTDTDIQQGGLRITTTIDKKGQDAAVAAMKGNLPAGVTGGLVAIRPGNGAVVAMYGGADYRKDPLNTATQAILQAGSNFKPFAVLAAVRDGISTKTKFDGDSPKKFGDTTVNNFGHRSYGKVDMTRMIGRSINTAFVDLNQRITPAKTRQAAYDAGIPESIPVDESLTNVLGNAAPHVIDMASAYSTIAAQGVRSKPYVISKVTSVADPGYVYEVAPSTTEAFGKDVNADTIDAMTATVKDGGTATKLQRLDRPIAGKTGTSESNKSIWFTGFVPQLAVSVGLYKPDANGNAQSMTDAEGYNLTGGTIPADIWYDFMKVVLENAPVVAFPPRVGVGDDQITQTPTQTSTPETTTSTTSTATTTVTETTTVTPTTAPETTTSAPTPTVEPTTPQPTLTSQPTTAGPTATATTSAVTPPNAGGPAQGAIPSRAVVTPTTPAPAG